ncbi:MAG TPA: cbb3-type cytochrome c oxidase N-terminal domain-containing protein [Oligoflexus sp.]|uniref:cbb3-type cytochrome c oxidase N-terminal domain-containing protein n=1 Tax=Oligoflexus sp. TaxID=1971216 RepID=UPI002D54DE93|nr:cbb3-type cytochrome c oxidase N-terminal domain-containing protein [Oligoflexus sp.]HYX31965.1 cbb3-type cytochrome c oxidase N-terminal domain-containing protein [Oligoflexus sp.]
MSEKKIRDVVRPNVVDGIEEYDNPLPPWWVWLFNLSIVFAFVYLIWYHVLDKPGLDEELALDRQELAQKASLQKSAMMSGDGLDTIVKDPKRVEEGQGIYVANCAPCHGPSGEGTVGPNLTDKFWIHGGTPDQVLSTITDGVPAKGMIAWGPILGPQKIESVLAYVLSLKDSNPPNAKAPEGDAY